ncbi:DUF4359 domain-containing protein [Microcoleus sp. FACHB-831]|uniref:DUF4359 domain-containing protein n=1 Tax=Microcoleus sp. FACHB-831 TaxID=2692827 RepID=UPI001683E893|nr:DUF4359 domain-containing protein [Microcoleus sp. FACHB-831]MBD1922118.1 DUF4359 domain-containing protein [Microcoleus sp. FACHB-831]
MKGLQIFQAIAGVVLVGLGMAMATTNPSQEVYEEFAVAQLSTYLKEEGCTQLPRAFGNAIHRQCTILVDTGRPQIQQMISESTKRQNFIFFSIYQTELSVSSFLPSYQFETLGVFENFYTYQAQKQ